MTCIIMPCVVYILCISSLADVAKLVDALDLGSSAARRGGSSPSIRTIDKFTYQFLDLGEDFKVCHLRVSIVNLVLR